MQTVGASHFVDRSSLLELLDEIITAESVEAALQKRLSEANPAPRPKALQVSLPDDLRHAMLPDLPGNVTLEPARIEIRADSAEAIVESLCTLAMIMQNVPRPLVAADRTAAREAGSDRRGPPRILVHLRQLEH